MTRPRWRKVLADIWTNRTRSLLIVASITVGLFALGVIATLYVVVSEDMAIGYSAVNPANIQISTGLFDDDVVNHVERIDGIRQAEGARRFGVRVEVSPEEWVTMDVTALPDFEGHQLNLLTLEQGYMPPGDKEILIDRYKFDDLRAQVGDSVSLETPSGLVRDVEIAGVVHDQTIGAFEAGAGFFLAPVQGYINKETLEWFGQMEPELYNILNLTVNGDSNDVSHIREVAERVRDDLENTGVEVVSVAVRASNNHPNRTYVDAISVVLFLLGFMVVFLSGFLITNTLQALLTQQVEQIAIMKTVGARRLQIVGIYMGLIFVFGVLAALISIPLANQVAFQQLEYLAYRINFTFLGYRVVPGVVLLQAAIALVIPQLAAFIPILQGARLSVREALSGINQSKPPSRGWLDRQITALRGFSRPVLISLRNTFRRKGRLLLTLITLTIGGAVFISTFNVQVSMADYVDRISNYFLADVNLTTRRPYRTVEIEQSLEQIPEVESVEGWSAARSEIITNDGSPGESVQLLAPPSDTALVDPILMYGRWLRSGDRNAIVLSDSFLTGFPDLSVGDNIRLRVNGRESDWVIVGFFQLAGKASGYLAYTNSEYLSELIGQRKRAVAFRVVAWNGNLTEQEQQILSNKVEEKLRREGIDVGEITTGQELSRTAAEGFALVTGFLLFLASLTALVGSIGLAGTMSLNVMERTREIGVMRAIGASNSTLMQMVILEGTLIGFFSWVLSVIMAFPMSKLLSDTISLSLFDAPSTFGYTPTGFLLWLGIVLLLSVLASVMPARKAARLTIREVLAYE